MKIIIITGQTASGKTKLALDLADKNNGELINYDSRQIYKYLDLITGKDKHLFKKIKMNLLDLVEPDKYFSSFDYVNLAVPLIKKLIDQGKTPVLVGGTYLYLKHLLYGVQTEAIPPDELVRKKLSGKSLVDLQHIYQNLDLQSFNLLNNSEKNNPQRLIRKIEIANFINEGKTKATGQVGKTLREKLFDKKIEIEFIGLKFKDRNNLRETIGKRVEERLKIGALKEVQSLLKKGYQETDPGLKTLGYQQLIVHLKGAQKLDDAIQIWINKEVQYAKRQLTFMKKDPQIKWREI